MKYRRLGGTDLVVSSIGFGCWAIGGHGYGKVDDNESIKAIRRALDLGINFFDTADVYGFGHSEEILAKALGSDNKKVVIATKFGLNWSKDGTIVKDCSPLRTEKALEDSLRRLNLDRIPLYQIHWYDDKVALEDTLAYLLKCKQMGKIQHIGCSNIPLDKILTIKREFDFIETIQVPLNIINRNNYANIFELYKKKKRKKKELGIITYNVLARGLLSGKYSASYHFGIDDTRLNDEEFQGERLERNLKIVNDLSELSKYYGITSTQLAISWALNYNDDICPIIGMKTVNQVEENSAAIDFKITIEDMIYIDKMAHKYIYGTPASLNEKKQIKFVEPAKVYRMIKDELDAAYFEVMSKGDLIDREQLRSFEDNLAKFVGTKYAVGLNSGYDALHMSLRAAGIGLGDEVIVPAHTFVASCSAIVNVGAEPILVDVGKDFNIDCEKIEEVLEVRSQEAGGRIKAIMVVHLSGYMADMVRVMEIAEKHNLVVVEDACQSLGASMIDNRSGVRGQGSGEKRMAGSWGLTGCWSFYPFKILGGYGDGGAITTNDPDVALFATRMRYNGEDRDTGEYHGHGFTCLLDNMQAAFLDVKLRYLPSWIVRRKEIAQRYQVALSDLPDLLLPHYDDPRRDHIYQNYTLRSKQGSAFSDHMKANGVEVLTQFRKPYYKHEALKLEDRGFPETEALSREVCSLPMNVEISDEEIDYVISVVRKFYKK